MIKKWHISLLSTTIIVGISMSSVAMAASPQTVSKSSITSFGLPTLPPASAFVPTRADAPPLVTHLTPFQMQLEQKQMASLANPAVHKAIMQAITRLPVQTVGPDQTAVASTKVGGFTLVESSQNPVYANTISGDPISQAQTTIKVYSAWGGD